MSVGGRSGSHPRRRFRHRVSETTCRRVGQRLRVVVSLPSEVQVLSKAVLIEWSSCPTHYKRKTRSRRDYGVVPWGRPRMYRTRTRQTCVHPIRWRDPLGTSYALSSATYLRRGVPSATPVEVLRKLQDVSPSMSLVDRDTTACQDQRVLPLVESLRGNLTEKRREKRRGSRE